MMDRDDRHLDGNAAAGVLADLFGEEMTAHWTICASCGRQHVVGRLVVYVHGMGVVLRCASCGQVQIKVGTLMRSYRVDMRGVRTFEVAHGS